MDLITQLPLSNNFDSTLVVVDRFSKMAIFIPAYGTITALKLAQTFISHVFSKHGLPKSPFFIIYGRNPSFDSIHISQDSPAGKLSTKLQSVQQVVKEELESAIRRFNKYADRNRSIPPDFQPGDRVWLVSKNIKTKRPTKELSERWLGPFEALKKFRNHAYHLKLPQQWKSFKPVFHVSLLEPVKQSIIPNHNLLPPPPALVEEQEQWEVAQVLDSKLKRGKLWYLVEWKGFSEDPERSTWEPDYNLTNSPDLVKDFHSLYPDKPGPNTSRV
ncbi:hypothetical protein O181_068338 [Austropuccinia psidii MF-1]|uniref:Chromo domain-containing protein n=1 Tax=Austropuccinia psidii MF-1 TaxID=1389203 RepID=A0A9Q3I5C2_9BASI|nr:hypothetical protein [Austropuccinia psidii MF-1]